MDSEIYIPRDWYRYFKNTPVFIYCSKQGENNANKTYKLINKLPNIIEMMDNITKDNIKKVIKKQQHADEPFALVNNTNFEIYIFLNN